jgi:hypothetical protein
VKRHALMTTIAGIAALTACAMPPPETGPMSFFVTSAGSGNGADLGGLAGADQICQTRASAVNAGNRTWRAYLSADAAGGAPAVNARDRIGSGPWYNAKNVLIAADLDELHSINRITKQTALTESGNVVNGRGDNPNQHDMLTGTNAQGMLATGDKNLTCNNWTSSGDGSAMVGHSDRTGLKNDVPAQSWNASHPSRGCSQQGLISTGGNGYFYCFAK